MPEGETPLDLAIKTSVEYGFSSRGLAEKPVSELKKNLLELVGGLDLSKEPGIMAGATEEEKRIAKATWQLALEKIREDLSRNYASGDRQWVMATLNELDPMDVEVKNIAAKPGEPPTKKIRRSVGLPAGTEVNFRQVRPDSPLTDNKQDTSQIIIGGFSFKKENVSRALTGEGPFQPMWRRNGVDFFAPSEGGGLCCVSISWEQAKTLLAMPEKELKRKIEILAREPLARFERLRSKDGRHGRRHIHIEASKDKVGLHFQGRTYGKETSASDDKLYRVYLQVEKEDIPRMVEILKELGTTRAQRGEGLNFKFLLGTFREIMDYKDGEYPDLKDGDPRIAVWLDSAKEQRDFILELLENPQYLKDLKEMSSRRKNPDGSWKARRPGSHVCYDKETGEELRAINYTEGGHSEDVIRGFGEDWRNHVRGTPTGKI